MKKCCSSKAFTMVELMVSIFVTIMIIASFYKLYNDSVRTERASSIRVAVDIMGEQILNTIAESIRMTGLNNTLEDYLVDTTGGTVGVIRYAGEQRFIYLSPFGSPITKVVSSTGDFPNCEFTLFNSAAFNLGVNKLYFHNQDSFFKTSSMSVGSYSDAGVVVETSGFTSGNYSGLACKSVFPAGSLVTGEDFIYTLEYTQASGNSLKLSYQKESDATQKGVLVDFSYNPDKSNSYSMPKFVLEYLIETCDNAGNCSTGWTTPKGGNKLTDDEIKGIIAVRFGFVLLSKKDRVYKGDENPADMPKYCIFSDKNSTENYYCYQLQSFNYTASVFRRVVYLSNYRFLKEQAHR